MKANEVASLEARISELTFVRTKRAGRGGSWFNIAKMLGRSEADVRRVYGFIDQPGMPKDFDPRVTHEVPSDVDGDVDGDADDDDDDGEDDAPRAPAPCPLTARMHALRAIAREPMTADVLAAMTGWSQTGARKAFHRLRDAGFAVQSHSGIWSITLKGRLAHALGRLA